MTAEPETALKQGRDVSRFLEATFSIYFQNFSALFRIAAAVIPIQIAAGVAVARDDGSLSMGLLVPFLAVLGLTVSVLAGGALTAAVASLLSGSSADFSLAYDAAFDRFWTLLGASLRMVFHVVLLAVTIVGIPGATQRAVRWMFVQQAVMLDGAGAEEALNRSADALEGAWWRTLGIFLVLWFIAALPASISWMLFYLAPGLISAIVGPVLGAAILPFFIVGMTLLYLDLKARKESDAPASSA